PLGFSFPGESEEIFRDRFVCLVDPGNSRLAGGALSLAAFGELPQAVATFGQREILNHAEMALAALGVPRHIQVTVEGWLPLPFAVAGTDLVAVAPERLARRVASTAGVVVCEPPFGTIELLEAVWWHATRSGDQAVRWLRSITAEVAALL